MVRYHTLLALRELGRRAQFLDGQLARLDKLITPLVTARAPGLLSLFGVGPDTAAMLLIAAGDNPGRLRSNRDFLEWHLDEVFKASLEHAGARRL